MSKTDLNELYCALHRLNRQMHRTAHREGHRKGDLYHGQANLLLLVLQSDGARQRDLAEQLDVRPSSMTEMLRKLEQNGLLERKQDDKDQRVMRIYLTEKGRQTAEEIAENKDTFAESFFQALSEGEQEQLLILIKKLCSSLETAENSYFKGTHHGPGLWHHGEHHHGLGWDKIMHHRHYGCHYKEDRTTDGND